MAPRRPWICLTVLYSLDSFREPEVMGVVGGASRSAPNDLFAAVWGC